MKKLKPLTKAHRAALEELAKDAAACVKLKMFGKTADPMTSLMVFEDGDKERLDNLSVSIEKAYNGDKFGFYNFRKLTNTIYEHPNIFKKFGFVIKKTPIEGINPNYCHIFVGEFKLAEGGNRG